MGVAEGYEGMIKERGGFGTHLGDLEKQVEEGVVTN